MDNDPARPISAEAHAAWETPFLQAPNNFMFRIRTLADATSIGVVAPGDIQWPHQCAMLGIAIGDLAYGGKGYDVLHYGLLRAEWEAVRGEQRAQRSTPPADGIDQPR